MSRDQSATSGSVCVYSFLGGVLFTLITLPTLAYIVSRHINTSAHNKLEKRRAELEEERKKKLKGDRVPEEDNSSERHQVQLVRTPKKDPRRGLRERYHKKNYLLEKETNKELRFDSGKQLEYELSRRNSTIPRASSSVQFSFLTRILTHIKDTPKFQAKLHRLINKRLKKIKLPSYVDERSSIEVQSIQLGNTFPRVDITDCTDACEENKYVCGAVAVVDFSPPVESLRPSIQLLFTVEASRVKIPVLLTISLRVLKGTLKVEIHPSPSSVFWVTFMSEPVLEFDIGHIVLHDTMSALLAPIKSKLPQLTSAIVDTMKKKLISSMVYPRWDWVPLPDMEDTPPSTPRGADKAKPTTSENTATTHSAPTTTSSTSPSVGGEEKGAAAVVDKTVGTGGEESGGINQQPLTATPSYQQPQWNIPSAQGKKNK